MSGMTRFETDNYSVLAVFMGAWEENLPFPHFPIKSVEHFFEFAYEAREWFNTWKERTHCRYVCITCLYGDEVVDDWDSG
jgi:hypothetical protein